MESQEISVDGTTITFAPLTLTIFNTKAFKDALIDKLNGCTHIKINFSNTTDFDISGFQLIYSLKNYSITNGLEFILLNSSEIVSTKLDILGVSL